MSYYPIASGERLASHKVLEFFGSDEMGAVYQVMVVTLFYLQDLGIKFLESVDLENDLLLVLVVVNQKD